MPARSTILLVATVASHLRLFHLKWVETLKRRGFAVVGVASDISTDRECQEAFDAVEDVPLSKRPLSLAQVSSAGRRLRALCSRHNVRLVHFHTPNAAFWGRLGLRRLVRAGTLKVAYTAHGFHFHRHRKPSANALFYLAERLASRYTHALLTINREDYQAAARFPLAGGGFRELIPGVGIDVSRFDPDKHAPEAAREALRRSIGTPGDSRLVLMLAEFSKVKRHRDAIDALARMNCGNVHLLFAGLGQPTERLRSRARDFGVADRIHFLGFRTDVPELLAAADLVLLASEREGLPTCVMEAMAMGKAVVGADARGTSDLLEGDCGWIYPVGDAEALAELLGRVLSDPGERKRRGELGRKRVLRDYTWPAVKAKLLSAYSRLGLNMSSTPVAADARRL